MKKKEKLKLKKKTARMQLFPMFCFIPQFSIFRATSIQTLYILWRTILPSLQTFTESEITMETPSPMKDLFHTQKIQFQMNLLLPFFQKIQKI